MLQSTPWWGTLSDDQDKQGTFADHPVPPMAEQPPPRSLPGLVPRGSHPSAPGGQLLTVAVLVVSMSASPAVVMMAPVVTMAVTLEPGLPVPADAAHDDGDAGEDDDHTYDSTRHQHRRHKQVTVLRAL